jgi:hypothetical protein
MFYNTSTAGSDFDLAARLESLGVVLDTSKSTTFAWMFYSSYKITRIPTIDTTSAKSLSQTFYGTKAHTIDKIILKEDGSQTFTETLRLASNLVNLTIEGTIG